MDALLQAIREAHEMAPRYRHARVFLGCCGEEKANQWYREILESARKQGHVVASSVGSEPPIVGSDRLWCVHITFEEHPELY